MAIPNAAGLFDYFEHITKQAQELVAAEQKPGFKPTDFDFETVVSCSHCSTPIEGKKFWCAKCKAPIYCSKKCAEKDWYSSPVPGAPTHRDLCKDNQRHMKKVPDIQAILLQFPWGRIEKDTSFSEDICRGRYKVLGGSNMGYWSHRGGPIPHLDTGDANQFLPPEYRKLLDFIGEKFNHTDGAELLKERHLTDRDGWRLEPELIPFLRFSSLWEPPRLVTKVQIKDWDSWYKWRRLPKESPAALLMSFPMSVYWILVEVLKIADPKKGSFDSDPISLTIHYIGAEKELNFLPLFGELALLLPHYHIKLVMFSKAVHTLTSLAKSKPNSLTAAALESPARPVFTYTAPEESGAGKVSVYLDTSDSWSASRLAEYGGPHARPDVLVAPNAGLSSYQGWRPVIIWSLANAMPFATTEYAEQSCEHQRASFGSLLAMQAQTPGSIDRGPWAPTPSQCMTAMMTRARSKEDFPIVLNPFQRPGQRPIPTYLPNVPNGFILTVCPYNDTSESNSPAQKEIVNSNREMHTPWDIVDIAAGLNHTHIEELD